MPGPGDQRPTLSEIASLVGTTDSAQHMRILETGATYAEIEEALARAQGNHEALGEVPRALAGRVAAVYEILLSDERSAGGLEGDRDAPA
jgi:hypothetical protein